MVRNGGKLLNQNITLKHRKELESKMAKVFKENINVLSTELQKILVDDMVTAFQNRINVLIRAQDKRSY
jgi:triphosphoribosyl-dephospho-CoA synthetase